MSELDAFKVKKFSDPEAEELAEYKVKEFSAPVRTVKNAERRQVDTEEQLPDDTTSLPETILTQTAVGVPVAGGLIDEAGGAIEALRGGDYDTRRDAIRAYLEKTRSDNPKAAFASNVAGGLLGLGGLGMAAKGSKLATGLNTLKGAAALGGLEGYTRSDGDLVDGEYGRAALGAATGAGLGVAGYGLGKVVEKAAPAMVRAGGALKDKAEKWAVEALRPYKKFTDVIEKRGIRNELGRDLLDSEVFTPKENLQFGVGAEEVLGNLENQSQARGSALDALFNTLQGKQADAFKATSQQASNTLPAQTGMAAQATAPVVANRQAMAGKIRDFGDSDIIRDYSPEISEITDKISDKMLERGTRFSEAFPNGLPLGLKELRETRGVIGDKINHFKTNGLSGSAEVMRKAYGALTGATKDHADELAAAYAPELQGGVRQGDKALEFSLLAEDIARNRVGADTANRMVSLTDNIVGAGAAQMADGLATGGVGGLAAAAGHKFVRERGLGVTARYADKLGNKLTQWGESQPATFLSNSARAISEGLPEGSAAELSGSGFRSLESYLGLARNTAPAMSQEEREKRGGLAFVEGTKGP